MCSGSSTGKRVERMSKQQFEPPEWGPRDCAEAEIDAGARALWGARAIDRKGKLDLPYNRHAATGDRALLQGVQIRDVLSIVEDAYRDLGDEPRRVYHSDNRQVFARRAGGYVYVLVSIYRAEGRT
jgi:hypothetical protein